SYRWSATRGRAATIAHKHSRYHDRPAAPAEKGAARSREKKNRAYERPGSVRLGTWNLWRSGRVPDRASAVGGASTADMGGSWSRASQRLGAIALNGREDPAFDRD